MADDKTLFWRAHVLGLLGCHSVVCTNKSTFPPSKNNLELRTNAPLLFPDFSFLESIKAGGRSYPSTLSVSNHHFVIGIRQHSKDTKPTRDRNSPVNPALYLDQAVRCGSSPFMSTQKSHLHQAFTTRI